MCIRDRVCYWGPPEAGLYETRDNGKRYFKDERFNRCFIDGDLSLIHILLVCAICFAGCGKQNEAAMRRDKNGQYQPVNYLNLTVWETQGTDFVPQPVSENDIVAKWLEEKTKVTVKTMYGNGGGQWDVKLTNLLNSDALPHIIHCGAGQGPAHFAKLDQLGKVWELTPEMIQEFAPEVWRKTPKDYWDKIKVNGKILGIPYISPISKESLPDADEDTISFMQEIFTGNKTDVTHSSGAVLWIRDDILTVSYTHLCLGRNGYGRHGYAILCADDRSKKIVFSQNEKKPLFEKGFFSFCILFTEQTLTGSRRVLFPRVLDYILLPPHRVSFLLLFGRTGGVKQWVLLL